MPEVVYLSDTQLAVTRSNELPPLVGFDSQFAQEPHPGTGKKILGWKWDERPWPSDIEFLAQDTVPSIWDPDNTALNPDDFESGIGDNVDLKVRSVEIEYINDRRLWSPRVEHGYYYDQDLEGYLYSDGAVQEHFDIANLVSGFNFLDLDFIPKPGVPISATKWKWNNENGEYNYAHKFTKKASFTGARDINGVRQPTRDINGNIIYANVSDEFKEFVVEAQLTPQKAILNGNYVEEHGAPGSPSYSTMEKLGVSNGTDFEEFHLLYSPVVPDGDFPIEIVSFFTEAGPATTWTVVNEITGPGECTVDLDLGIVRFGEGAGFHPAYGETVAAHYKSTVMLEYEPENTTDLVSATEINLNPLGKTSSGGFIYLKREVLDPASIVLEADAALLGPNVYGPVFLGTATRLLATVTSKSGEPIEGLEVTFDLVNNVGGFSGGVDEISSLTNFNGVARTSFNSPRNIRSLGAVSKLPSDVVHVGPKTEITLDTTSLIGNPAEWYIYKVFNNDPVMGVVDLDQYYIDYFAQEGIFGPTTQLDLDSTGAGWEQTHRILLGLLTPTKYDANIRNGRKQLVITWDAAAVDPHTFAATGAFVPIRPESVVYEGTNTKVTVNALLPIPGSLGNENLAGYFVVGPTIAQVQASVYNERLGVTILSNVIQLEVRVPPSMDGTVLIETLNDAQRNALFGGPGPASGTLPLGFRLRSNGFNLAAVLDGLTYLDVNRPTGILGHAFTVIDPGV